MNDPLQGTQIIRGFEYDSVPAGNSAEAAAAAARAQLEQCRIMLEMTLIAVLDSCPEAIDAAFAQQTAGLVLRMHRLSKDRVG